MGLSKLKRTSYQSCSIETLSVALVGLGALGSEIARLLGVLGIGTVALVDNDKVESVNSLQSIFFRNSDALGCYKAEVIANHGLTYFPRTRWIPHVAEIADAGFKGLKNCALMISATDSVLSRVETAYVSRKLRIPMVDAGLSGPAYWRGRAAWFPAETNAACYCCQLSENRRAEILSLTCSPVLSCRWAEENRDMPSTPTMASVVAGMAVDLAFRHGLFAKEESSFAWEIDLGNPPGLVRHVLSHSSTCPFHDLSSSNTLVELAYNEPFQNSLTSLDADAFELDWPIAIHATCLRCHHRWQPLRRMAWVRRYGRCQQCRESARIRYEAIDKITRNSGEAQFSPADLSYAEDHLYTPVYHTR